VFDLGGNNQQHQLQKQQHPPAPQQQHPVTWQPNSDGTKMIGRMVLTKNMAGIGVGSLGGGGGGGGPSGASSIGGAGNPSSASILGLKVVGGKRVDNGRLAAIVEKVKRGSVADTIGHLRPGTFIFSLLSFIQFDICEECGTPPTGPTMQ
jgi:hypothetical protein